MYGSHILKRGDSGPDVEELQIRLSGFRGTIPDGSFGPGTELQVTQFQKDFMGISNPSGMVDKNTYSAIDSFALKYPISFDQLKCPCKVCSGFGRGLFKGVYYDGKPKVEAYYQYEYPGIHRITLWALRAIWFYHPNLKFICTSGYRCSVDNERTKRTSTNHRGKAVDTDHLSPGQHKEDDMVTCTQIRGKMIEVGGFQLGWLASNRKSFEPDDIAPTWIHLDSRSFESKYLEDRFFCKSLKDLDNVLPITV